jgi:hypothetical protein
MVIYKLENWFQMPLQAYPTKCSFLGAKANYILPCAHIKNRVHMKSNIAVGNTEYKWKIAITLNPRLQRDFSI